MENFDFKIDQK